MLRCHALADRSATPRNTSRRASLSLQLTRNLIQLDRGSDELLLSNAFYMRPLYVAYGRRRIVELLSELPKGRTLEQLKSDFAADEKLIQLLRDHRILVDPLVEKEGYDPRARPRARQQPLAR